jgi:hypothetical protein
MIASMSEDLYRAHPAVANSDLFLLHTQGPVALKQRAPRRETPALRFGRLAHLAILEPDRYAKTYAVKPKGYRSGTVRAAEWQAVNGNLQHVTHSENEKLCRMSEAVAKHKEARHLFRFGQPEQCLFATDEHGTERKARLDWLNPAGLVLPDLKTCESLDRADPYGFWGFFDDKRYAVQGAYYMDIAERCGHSFADFAFVAVTKKPPFAVEVVTLTTEQLEQGRAEYEADLAVYRHCVATDTWPERLILRTQCPGSKWAIAYT